MVHFQSRLGEPIAESSRPTGHPQVLLFPKHIGVSEGKNFGSNGSLFDLILSGQGIALWVPYIRRYIRRVQGFSLSNFFANDRRKKNFKME
jgi:hypothetical protein